MVNGEPLTILAKKSNHRCLTLSKIQLSLSLFLSLSHSISLSRFQQRLLRQNYWKVACLFYASLFISMHTCKNLPCCQKRIPYSLPVSFMLLHSLESACITHRRITLFMHYDYSHTRVYSYNPIV